VQGESQARAAKGYERLQRLVSAALAEEQLRPEVARATLRQIAEELGVERDAVEARIARAGDSADVLGRLSEIPASDAQHDPVDALLENIADVARWICPDADIDVRIDLAGHDGAAQAPTLEFEVGTAGPARAVLTVRPYAPPLDDRTTQLLELLTSSASTALENATLLATSAALAIQLNEALRTRGVIERAKGMLMERTGCDDDAAFTMLRDRSQRENVKLNEIARRLVEDEARGRGDLRPS
jgi:hypothetical protein